MLGGRSTRVSLEPLRRDARPKPLVQVQGGPLRRDDEFQSPLGYDAGVHHNLLLVETDRNTGILIMIPIDWWMDANWYQSHDTARCLKTTAVYEQLAAGRIQVPPRGFLNYLTSDPWTRLPLFEKPPGPLCMKAFLDEHGAVMYNNRDLMTKARIKPAFRPLIYQWILDTASALSFLHANDIMIGDITPKSFIVSFPDRARPPQAFLAGFPDACFRSNDSGVMICGAEYPHKDFPMPSLSEVRYPTRSTDIFLLGNLIYRCMTDWLVDEAWREEPNGGLGPPLEDEYLGDLARKCWSGGYTNGGEGVEDFKKELIQFLGERGFAVEDDTIQDLTIGELPEPRERSYTAPGHAWLPPFPEPDDVRYCEEDEEVPSGPRVVYL